MTEGGRRVVRRTTHETETETVTIVTETTITETTTYSDGITEVVVLDPASAAWVAAQARLDRTREPEGVTE